MNPYNGGGGGSGFMVLQPPVVLGGTTTTAIAGGGGGGMMGLQEKINRELFVGNTPPGTPELLLLHFVNAAMRRIGLCQPHETPVLNSRVNNKFAFIELVSAEMANRALNLNGIPFLGAFLKVSRPSKYSGPAIPARTWQEITGQALPQGASIDPDQEKIRRELFIGNTTPEMTEAMLKEFLGNALVQVGLATAPGNPINACRVSGKYAFIELRSAEEAANALNLNNIPFLGTALRVGRPSKYAGPPDQHGNWEDILAKYMSGELALPSQQSAGTETFGAATGSTNILPHQQQQQQEALRPASRVVELQHMLTHDDLIHEEEYQDILEDTREECSQFGPLLSVIIPRAGQIGATKVFLEYSTATDAAKAIEGLQGRTFDGRRVMANYFDENKFAAQDYS